MDLCEEQLVQGHGIHVLAVLVHTHIARGNFVNQHDLAVGVVAELELDVVQVKALLLQIVGHDFGDGLGLGLQGIILLGGHDTQGDQTVLGDQGIAQSVISLVQEQILGKFYTKKLEAEENARYEARQADRQKRMEEGRRQQETFKEPAPKMTLKEQQKAAQEAKANKQKITTNEAGRVDDRPYARGRSYQADRYDSEK